jgi:type 1 glutamine amidotransferase
MLLVLLAGCNSAETEQSAVEASNEAATKNVLIVTGIDYPGHDWRQTAPALADLLRQEPRFHVDVVEEPEFLASPRLDDYDVVVLHFMDWETPDPGPNARRSLRGFVSGGKGLFIVHFACGAFQEWPEFRNLAGRVWDPKLRGHDPRGPFTVEITDAEHPITRGMQSFETDDELYTCLTGDDPITVLATARSKVDSKDYPMAFVLTYGKGKVFHSVLGHDVKAICNPNVAELFRRGCAWTAGLVPVRE